MMVIPNNSKSGRMLAIGSLHAPSVDGMIAQVILSACTVFVLCLLGSPACSCQEEGGNRESESTLGGGIGVNDFHDKDRYLSPYIFRGLMASARISYEVNLPGARHILEAWFSSGHTDSDLQPRDVTQYTGRLAVVNQRRDFHRCRYGGCGG